MRQFSMAANMDIPIVDADTMGRAFPKVDMSLPYVYKKASTAPAVLSDARGNVQIIAAAEDATRFENMVRVASVELGLFTALCLNPLTYDVVQNYCCHRSVSTAWYIGRQIYRARQRKSDIVESIVGWLIPIYIFKANAFIQLSAIPGSAHLYSGKIVDIARNVQGGWTVGTATLNPDETESSPSVNSSFASQKLPMVIQYQVSEIFSHYPH